MAGERVDALLRDMQESYDLVIFDAPPLHAATDASVLASKTTGVLVVVSAGQTTVSSLEGGAETLRHVGATMLGIVLNNYDARRSLRYGYGEAAYGYYGYGYSRYSAKGREKIPTNHG